MKILDADSTGISVSSTFTSMVPLAPLSIILLPKLELKDLSFGRDPVLLTVINDALESTVLITIVDPPPAPVLPTSIIADFLSSCSLVAPLSMTNTATGRKLAGANRVKSSKSIATKAASMVL